ncbi:MAG: hypothetical protein ACYS76_04510 [Planctomycetota bacterium]|jgi:hypothetical protein
MKLLILCVDGFDPDYGVGFNKLRYRSKLTIPEGCFIESPDGPQPATGLVWPTILSGKVQDTALIKRSGLRKWGHDWLLRHGVKWDSKPKYKVGPWNYELDTVLTGRMAFTFNLPTISPEWIVSFPDKARLNHYTNREYNIFLTLAHGLITRGSAYEVGALYTRIVDVWGHLMKSPDDMNYIYMDIAGEVWRLAQKQMARDEHVLMISDHGCFNGVHTDKAFMGATFPFEAESILDIRGIIEGVLN